MLEQTCFSRRTKLQLTRQSWISARLLPLADVHPMFTLHNKFHERLQPHSVGSGIPKGPAFYSETKHKTCPILGALCNACPLAQPITLAACSPNNSATASKPPWESAPSPSSPPST
eukprot:1152440-Pelagomonas_calceolata.AAC.5